MSQIDPAAFRALQNSLFAAAVTSAALCGACLTLGVAAIRRLRGLADLPRRTFWGMSAIVIVVVILCVVLNFSVLSLLRSVLLPTFRGLPAWTVPAIFTSIALSFSIGDGVFIYRCWIIWGRSRWVFVPILIFSAELATSYYSLILAGHRSAQVMGGLTITPGDTQSQIPPRALITGLSAILLTVSLNTLLAAAAVARLLHARRQLRLAAPSLDNFGAHYVKISLLLALSTLVYAAVWIPLIWWYRDARAAPYYVLLIAFTAAMPLGVMLQVGGERDEMKYVLPALTRRSGEGEAAPTMEEVEHPRTYVGAAEIADRHMGFIATPLHRTHYAAGHIISSY